MKECIFCKIAEKEIPADIVYEDSRIMVFLDVNAASNGHTLVIPKKHYETINEIPDSLLGEIAKVIKKVSKGVLKATNCKDFNLLQNNGKAAGQFVMHAHFHIIPRKEKDGLTLGSFPGKKYENNENKDITRKIRYALTE